MNNQHPHFKFACQSDFETKSVAFLDLMISIDEDGYIQTTLYTKPNVRNGLLKWGSCHPGHCTKNIPKNIMHRVVRNCSKVGERDFWLESVGDKLRARNYPETLIKYTITWAKSLDRSETLEKVVRERGEEGVVNCVMRFDTRSPDHASIMKRHCKLIVCHDPFCDGHTDILERGPDTVYNTVTVQCTFSMKPKI